MLKEKAGEKPCIRTPYSSTHLPNADMIIDSHCHIFTERIVQNIGSRPEMAELLNLGAQEAFGRLLPENLRQSAVENGIDFCVLLPTAAPEKVREQNDRFLEIARCNERIRSLGTLHPRMSDPEREIDRVFDEGVKGFKFSSFSQKFDPTDDETHKMLRLIAKHAIPRGFRAVVVLDTFTRADKYFGARREHLTLPGALAGLTEKRLDLDIVAAHMGGLAAEFHELRNCLAPAPNLFLDTSNAAHTLSEQEFVELLGIHGPDHILFGTDWPWFGHEDEIPRIGRLLVKAGFDEADQSRVFGGTARKLFGL